MAGGEVHADALRELSAVLKDTLRGAVEGWSAFLADDLADWSAYPHAVGREHLLNDVGDLSLFLGGDRDSFTAQLLHLVAKARFTPDNLNRLALAFPRAVIAYLMWETLCAGAIPTAGTLADILTITNNPGRRGRTFRRDMTKKDVG